MPIDVKGFFAVTSVGGRANQECTPRDHILSLQICPVLQSLSTTSSALLPLCLRELWLISFDHSVEKLNIKW